ncbi:MAG: hypothetical protein RR678_08250 [Lachnospiraceae bacterium]
METNKQKIWLVIPCYNEEAVLNETAIRFHTFAATFQNDIARLLCL